MNIQDAQWEPVKEPATTERYFELAGGQQGPNLFWQVLIAQDGFHAGKIFRRWVQRDRISVPAQTISVKWEGLV